jgi:hypothetical protein
MRRAAIVTLVVAAVLWSADRPCAWGVEGHHIVARIALTRLTPETQRAVTTILGTEDFVTISTWADEVRTARPETYNWHFVDIPYGNATYDAARDCAPTEKGDCVIAEIERARHVLGDTAQPAIQRSEALKYLVHFVGDMHQPLHAIDNHDRGGNDVHVSGDTPRPTNLHAMWDTGILQRRGLTENAYAQFLIDELQAHPLPASENRVNVIRWAEDSHRVGAADVYHYPEFAVDRSPTGNINLDDEYVKRAKADIDRQLQLGGVHLAALLNETLGLPRATGLSSRTPDTPRSRLSRDAACARAN